MKLTFLGAARTVTGSCFLIETRNSRILVDCGLFQGRSTEEAMNEQPLPVKPSTIDYVLLTHAHIDHSGRIPWLYTNGFKGEVIAVKAAVDLCRLLLPDSGHIHEFEADLIAAEDTRHTLKLLNHYEIKKSLISYYEHNKRERGNELILQLESGKNIALVTDAGTPGISDPGEDIVKLAIENDIPVVMVPGPTALIMGVVLSGLPCGRFDLFSL